MNRQLIETCPNCGSRTFTEESQTHEFEFRAGGRRYAVKAVVPVQVCGSCGAQTVGPLGEYAQHEAICHAMGRLAPDEIRLLRKSLALSRKQFSKLSGIGAASLARWESGELIQSESNDNLLRLLSKKQNADALASVRDVVLTSEAHLAPNIAGPSVAPALIMRKPRELYSGLDQSTLRILELQQKRFQLASVRH